MTAAPTTITLRGRTFTVTTTVDREQRVRYLLAGKRGASYTTMRNQTNPDVMFLANLRGFGIPAGFEGVWVTDVTGVLTVVSQ
jgi:hypothetical protein